jgi:two-component system sensor histidine kinase KdpD
MASGELPFQMPTARAIRRSLLVLLRGAVLIAAISWICFHAGLNAASTALVLLVVVALHSLDCSFVESAAVSVFAVAGLDFFFIDPRFSLTVASPSDVLTLACFLVISLTVTRLQSTISSKTAESRIQRENTARLYGLSQELLSLDPGLPFGASMLKPILRNFELTAVCVFDAETLESYTSGNSRRDLENRTREAYVSGRDLDHRESRIAVRCLWVRGKIAGAIGFEGLRNSEIAIPPLTSAVAAALERARAFRAATTAAAQAQAEELRSAILDALAHEIKTPLAAILAAAGGIRAMDASGTDLVELIETEASRLSDLTSRLLRIGRLDRDEIKPRLESVSASELAGPLARRYAKVWPDRRIAFRAPDRDVEIRADRDLLSLAVSQLLENACRYSRPDANVWIEVWSDGSAAAVAVSNDGDPLPPADRARVFDRFYRGREARRAGPGTGLGLYVARKIALAHGGDITLVDAGPHTVTFRLWLPWRPIED